MANARNTVWVERIDGRVVRIFRTVKGPDFARVLEEGNATTWPKKDAVSEIWETLWKRAAGKCEYGCGRTITRTGWTKGEMHEEVPRGRGGEISLFNSKMVCRQCHRTDARAHGNRRLRFGETFEEILGE
jgi:hypothetical protein